MCACSRRLLDYRSTERAYFKKTGIFPIMHAVAIKKSLAKKNPQLMEAVFTAYSQAKEIAYVHMAKAAWFKDLLPWSGQEFEETRAFDINYDQYKDSSCFLLARHKPPAIKKTQIAVLYLELNGKTLPVIFFLFQEGYEVCCTFPDPEFQDPSRNPKEGKNPVSKKGFFQIHHKLIDIRISEFTF